MVVEWHAALTPAKVASGLCQAFDSTSVYHSLDAGIQAQDRPEESGGSR